LDILLKSIYRCFQIICGWKHDKVFIEFPFHLDLSLLDVIMLRKLEEQLCPLSCFTLSFAKPVQKCAERNFHANFVLDKFFL